MNKLTQIIGSLLMGTAMLSVPVIHINAAEESANKQTLQVGAKATYYGEVSNGQPDGKGTMKWSDNKYYSGQWNKGERQGIGKYVNKYMNNNGETIVTTYTGTWENDKINGEGTLMNRTLNVEGGIQSHQVQQGTFTTGVLKSGYTVTNAVADPPFCFQYKDSSQSLIMYGDNQDIIDSWKRGYFMDLVYQRGTIQKSYSVMADHSPVAWAQNMANLKYLQGQLKYVQKNLKTLETLSRQVPLT